VTVPEPLRALVTCGGTREPVDDVRVITNLSRGRFGATIVRALLAAGVEVTVLGSREALALLEDEPGPLTRVGFGSFADLAAALEQHTETPPDLLFMAAAVSDYTPVKAAGKLRSDADQRQVLGCRLNMTVANDLKTFTEADHPVVLVTPEGGAVAVPGRRERVAEELVAFALARHRTDWSRSEQVAASAEPDGGHARAAQLLTWAQGAGLLRDRDGNATSRADGEGLWATPRGVDKSSLGPADLVRVTVDEQARAVRYAGAHKPSIDSAVHGWLYARLPELQALLHGHGGLVLPDATTSFPWPCGTAQAANGIHAALGRAAAAGRWAAGGCAVELVHHGWLLALGEGTLAQLEAGWAQARAAYGEHLASLGEASDGKTLSPVLRGAEVVGVLAQGEAEGPASEASARWSSVFLLDQARGQGLGVACAEHLDALGAWVRVHEGCGVLGFYLDMGWRPARSAASVTDLEPPSRRADLIEAASVCLLEPSTGRVLLGRRKRGARVGGWCFPGGKLDPGESALACARRELREETGVDVTFEPSAERVLTVGNEDGAQAFRLTCFVAPVPPGLVPRASQELEAEWVPAAEALTRDLTPGVARVLRGLSG
jgi:8-oxo-dGTP pyrophosphatase MutT (NUDIX family)